jgi:signal peptidase I
LALALAPLVFLHPIRVSGRSMEPCLRDGVVRLALRAWCSGTPVPGQVWLIRTPGGVAVKRLAGLPGERLEIREGTLRIDGAMVEEPYALPDPGSPEGPWETGPGYFLLGDNRPASHDCRAWGPLRAGDLLGRVLLFPGDGDPVVMPSRAQGGPVG